MEPDSELSDRPLVAFSQQEENSAPNNNNNTAFKPSSANSGRSPAYYFTSPLIRDPGLEDVYQGRAACGDNSGALSRTASLGHGKGEHGDMTQNGTPVVMTGSDGEYMHDFAKWESGVCCHDRSPVSPFPCFFAFFLHGSKPITFQELFFLRTQPCI
jgi:hypothetical protein